LAVRGPAIASQQYPLRELRCWLPGTSGSVTGKPRHHQMALGLAFHYEQFAQIFIIELYKTK